MAALADDGFALPRAPVAKTRCRTAAARDFPEGLAMDNASKCPVSGKRKYPTEGAALATAKHEVATADAPLELHAYRCNWCHAWHLTKKAEKAGEGRR